MAILVKDVSIMTMEGARLKIVIKRKICMELDRCWGSVIPFSSIFRVGFWPWAWLMGMIISRTSVKKKTYLRFF